MASVSTPTMSHYPSAQTSFQPPLIANDNAFLGDVFSSETTSPSAPISAGFFRLAPGPELVYTYTYDEMKIVLEGEFEITDQESGETVVGRKGDVFRFGKGAKITFRTKEGALAWYCGQRGKDKA